MLCHVIGSSSVFFLNKTRAIFKVIRSIPLLLWSQAPGQEDAMLNQHSGAGAECKQRLDNFSFLSPVMNRRLVLRLYNIQSHTFSCKLNKDISPEGRWAQLPSEQQPRLGQHGCRLGSCPPSARRPHFCLTCLGPPWTSGDFQHLEEQVRGGKRGKGPTTYLIQAVVLEADTHTSPIPHLPKKTILKWDFLIYII